MIKNIVRISLKPTFKSATGFSFRKSIACLLITGFTLILSFTFTSSDGFSKTVETNSFSKSEKNSLIKKFSALKKLKVPTSYIKKIFNDRRVIKYPDVLPKNINNKQVKRNYSSFYEPYSQHLTKKFMKKWRSRFVSAEKKYKVDQEAIAAIILVETGLGSIRGRYHVFSVYASIVVEATTELAAGVENTARYEKKLKWATGELVSLLILSKAKKLNILKLKGSSSGAFGLSQFLPSSFQQWAVDGDGNGHINLHYPPDAIPSIANYLKIQGWQQGIENEANRKAVFHYNNSNIYVDTILDVASKLQTNRKGWKPAKKITQAKKKKS